MAGTGSLHDLFEGTGRPCTLGHEDLLTLARKVEGAAEDADVDRLDEAIGRFAEALACHLEAETSRLATMEPAEARILERGQARVLAVADEIRESAEQGCPSSSHHCEALAQELLALLTLQVGGEGSDGRLEAWRSEASS